MPLARKLDPQTLTDFSLRQPAEPAILDAPAEEPDSMVFHQDDLDAAFQNGFDAGYEKAKLEMHSDLQHKQNALITRMCEALHTHYQPFAENNQKLRKDFLTRSADILRQLLARVNVAYSQENLQHMLEPLIAAQKSNPDLLQFITIYVNADDLDTGKTLLSPRLEKDCKAITVEFKPSSALNPGECHIEWQDGSLSFTQTQHNKLLDSMITELLQTNRGRSDHDA